MNENMKQNLRFRAGKQKIRNIEDEALFLGAHGVPIENSIAETNSDFDAAVKLLMRESAEIVKDLEANREVARHRREDAEKRWLMWNAETAGKVPPIAPPLWKIVTAFAAMAGEAVLLAPLMDLFGVADPSFQFVLAGVIVIVLALLCEIPIHMWRGQANRYAVYAVGVCIGFGLIALGMFRAFGLKAIEAKSSPLIGGFLDENSLLSAVVIAFLTVALPVGAAFAFDTGWFELSRRLQWKKARREALNFAEMEEIFAKKTEAEIEKCEKMIAALDEERKARIAAQRQAHEEGKRMGARRRPFWEIAFFLFGGCILITVWVLALLYIFADDGMSQVVESDLGRFALYFGFALGLMSLFSYYVLKRWNSPTVTQFARENRTPIWSGVAPGNAVVRRGAGYALDGNPSTRIFETAEEEDDLSRTF